MALFRAVADADPANYLRGQYDGYLSIDGVAAGSTTETYVALRLDIDNWRWLGVPFFIRACKCLPVTQTELRVVFKRPPGVNFGFGLDREHPPSPDQSGGQAGPHDWAAAHRRRAPSRLRDTAGGHPGDAVRRRGRGGETPYEVLLHAAMVGDSTRFKRQDVVEEDWRIMQPLLDAPPAVSQYAPGTWGPAAADRLVADHGGWHRPWVV